MGVLVWAMQLSSRSGESPASMSEGSRTDRTLRGLRRLATSLVAFVLVVPCGIVWAQGHDLYPAGLEYRGAFRLPQGAIGGSTWSYGGGALAYNPDGDPAVPDDAYPGSLYGTGFDGQLVSEVSIPAPVIAANHDATLLPVAETLQPFSDVSAGLKNLIPGRSSSYVGGLAYLPPQGAQLTPKINWAALEPSDDGGDNDGLGWSELDLAAPQAQGLWHIGPRGDEFHSSRTENYLFDIPRSWADQHVDGQYLAAGRSGRAGASGASQGPTLYSTAPWNSGNPPASGAEVDATALLYYPALAQCYDHGTCYYPDYKACDDWDGGAWLTAGSKSAVLVVGSKGMGDVYYGDARPQDCDQYYRGYHCGPYQGQFLFYDSDDLATVAAGLRQPWEVLPYAVFNAEPYLWPDCRYQLGGAAFDRDRGILYVIQKNVDETSDSQPLVHVFQVRANESASRVRLAVTKLGEASGTVTSDVPGIDCGSDCEALYAQGQVVQLFPDADPSSEFAGWGGDADCADGIVTLETDRHCSARFQAKRQSLGSLSISQSASKSAISGSTTSEIATRATRAGTESVTLAWDLPVPDDSRIEGFEIHYGQASGQYTLPLIDVPGHATSSAPVPNLNNGETYYFAVRSRNSYPPSEWSIFSNEVCTTIGESAPSADFTADVTSGDAPLTVTFTAMVPGCTNSWQWDFGDGGSSTQQQPTHIYVATGSYEVGLTVSGPGFVLPAVIKTDYIIVAPGTPTYTLTVNSSGASGVSITSSPTGYGGTTNYTKTGMLSGTSVALTAPSTSGSTQFTSWTGCSSVSGQNCTVSMTANKTVTANYSGGTGGLVAAYGFDESGGGVALDASGNNNDGTLLGPTRTVAGKFGAALSFDGVNDWVSVDDDATLDLTDGMTLEAWVRPSTLAGVWRTVIFKETSNNFVYDLYAHDPQVTFGPTAEINVGGTITHTPATSSLPVDAWSHLAVTYDGSDVQLFVSGSPVGDSVVSGNLMVSDGPLHIGGNIWGSYFSGLIDEVRIYNRALSAGEVQADMNAPVNGGPSCSSTALEVVGPVTYSAGGHHICSMLSITTTGQVIIPNGANTTFQAPVVSLTSGFEVQAEGVFAAGP